MNLDYKYIVNGRQVNPINTGDFKLKGKKPADFWYTFIKEFGSEIVFDNHTKDFEYFKQYEGTCTEMAFNVYQNNIIKFAGYFTCNTGKWDNDRETFTVKIKPNDESRAIIEGLKTTQNILALGLDRVTTTGLTIPSLAYSERTVVKQSSYWKVESGILTRETFNNPNASGTPIMGTTIINSMYPYYRSFGNPYTFTFDSVDSVTGEPLSTFIDQWIAMEIKITVSEDQNNLYFPGGSFYPPLRIIQEETLVTEIYTVEGTDTSTPPATGAVVKEVTNINGIDVVIWWRRPNYTLGVAVYLPKIEQSGVTVDSPTPYTRWKLELSDIYPATEYTRNLYLFDVIEKMLQEVGFTGTFRSKFLTENVNYVTGQGSKTNKITIAQRSDIEQPTSTEPATLAEITLEELLLELNTEMDLWMGFEGDILILEHSSYWDLTNGTDITGYTKQLYKTDKYSYLEEKMPQKETWQYQEAQNTDFLANSIKYNTSCTNEDEILITCKFCNDLAYMAATGIENNNGFVLLANEEINGTLYVINEGGLRSGGVVANGHLSLSNLLENYHRHNRVRLTGMLNFENQTFENTTKKREQVPITVPCEIDINRLVKASLGWGEIKTFEKNLKTKHTKITLLYD